MSSSPRPGTTLIAVSFVREYATLARRVAEDLRSANLAIQFDQWEGTAKSAEQSTELDVRAVDGIVVIFTPSQASPTWVGDHWKRSVFDEARARDVPVFGVRGDECVIPEFLSALDFADLHRRGYGRQLRRLLRSIDALIPGATVVIGDESDHELDEETWAVLDQATPTSIDVRLGTAFAPLLDPRARGTGRR